MEEGNNATIFSKNYSEMELISIFRLHLLASASVHGCNVISGRGDRVRDQDNRESDLLSVLYLTEKVKVIHPFSSLLEITLSYLFKHSRRLDQKKCYFMKSTCIESGI